ncbi:hypothetical protein KKH24_03810 [Patescibacteria group bacterium]|nr:hypothetical protein [Patescibacteria group bacterium]
MMQIIDFSKLNPQRLNTTIAEMGMVDFNNLPFPAILEQLGVWSDRKTEENFPPQQLSGRIDLSEEIQQLRRNKKIVDVIGPIKIPKGTSVCFSTLLGTGPKVYLMQYIEVAKIFCRSSSDLRFIVWLEDTLTTLKHGWDASMKQRAVDLYTSFFKVEFPECEIIISSRIAPIGVPRSFTEKLRNITAEEFISALPFHMRNTMFIKTLDIVHFVWNCYLLHCFPGIYLAGANNKRHFQLFRKVSGQQITAVLLPLGSENLANN